MIGGDTVHSFFSINCDLDITLENKSGMWYQIYDTDVIIIDEARLLSGEMLHKINELLNTIESNANTGILNALFGNKSLILIGDLLQLAAVSTYEQPITQLYISLLFRNNFKPFFLTQNYRQRPDTVYADLLLRLRYGQLNGMDHNLLETRVCGKGNNIGPDCIDYFNSVNICSLHIDRKKITNDILDKYFDKQKQVIIHSIDVIEKNIHVPTITQYLVAWKFRYRKSDVPSSRNRKKTFKKSRKIFIRKSKF